LETPFVALQKLWEAATLSHTPKLHSLLMHALLQMKMFSGIRDILEDDVEKMHQIAGRSESRVARLKSATNRALAEAEIEAISKDQKVKQNVEKSKELAKRKFSDLDTRLKLAHKKKSQKYEQDQKQIQTVAELCDKLLPKIVSVYEKLKVDVIKQLTSHATSGLRRYSAGHTYK
jgi:hypothetical protein